jgi:hypothetical protein
MGTGQCGVRVSSSRMVGRPAPAVVAHALEMQVALLASHCGTQGWARDAALTATAASTAEPSTAVAMVVRLVLMCDAARRRGGHVLAGPPRRGPTA